MNDQDFKEIFTKNKIDVSDKGFSERVIRRLPERKSLLPKIVMLFSITIGLIFTFSITGITPLIEQINDLIKSVGNLQIPSPSSVFTYLFLLATIGIICFSLVHTDTD